jgi:chemotaxis-related protein WspD
MNDCWNQIGVWSKLPDKCEKLQQVIHCRNCDVYTKAGREALEKTPSAQYNAQRTKRYAQVPPAASNKACSVVIFRLGVEWFCLPTLYFQSIENRSVIHSIPRYSNELLLGVVNIKGTLLLCFSVESLLQVEPDNAHPLGGISVYKRLLVLSYNQQSYTFPVDEVGGIDRIDDNNLETPPATLSQHQAGFVKGVVKSAEKEDKHRIALLNAVQLFQSLGEAIGG